MFGPSANSYLLHHQAIRAKTDIRESGGPPCAAGSLPQADDRPFTNELAAPLSAEEVDDECYRHDNGHYDSRGNSHDDVSLPWTTLPLCGDGAVTDSIRRPQGVFIQIPLHEVAALIQAGANDIQFNTDNLGNLPI